MIIIISSLGAVPIETKRAIFQLFSKKKSLSVLKQMVVAAINGSKELMRSFHSDDIVSTHISTDDESDNLTFTSH